MQIGFNSEGTRNEVIQDLQRQIKKEAEKFKKLCNENQSYIGDKPDGKGPIHDPMPIRDTTSEELLKLAFNHVQEQLAHVKDDESVAASFNITVHRPNPVSPKSAKE